MHWPSTKAEPSTIFVRFHRKGRIALIIHLDRVRSATAFEVAQKWLSEHAGRGRLLPLPTMVETKKPPRTTCTNGNDPRRLERSAVDKGDAGGDIPVDARLTPSDEDMEQLRWLPKVRGDEGAMLAALTDNSGNLVANQDTYLTNAGHKSLHDPVRRTFRGPHDWNVRGLVRFGNPNSKKVFICEGVEDALSARQAGAECVVALTGIARLRRVDIPADVEVVVLVRDDDASGSPADEALWKGVVAVIGKTDSRTSVMITPKPSSMVVSNVVSLRAPKRSWSRTPLLD